MSISDPYQHPPYAALAAGVNQMPTSDEAKLEAADAKLSKLLFAYMRGGRKHYIGAGASPMEAFTRTYWTLVNAVVAGAVAYDIPESVVHEIINEAFTNANTPEAKAEVDKLRQAHRGHP